MEIKINDLKKLLSRFSESASISLGGETKCTLHVLDQFYDSQIQLIKDDNDLKYRIVSSEERLNMSDYERI